MSKQTFEQQADEMWVTAVQVATVWTMPESARSIDHPGLTNPTDIDQWMDVLTFDKRVALCDENRVQSQLLYGESVIITETKDDWAHVVIPSQPSKKDQQGYPGWVPLNQLKKVSKTEWEQDKTAAVLSKFAWLESANGKPVIKLSFMTMLPVIREQGEKLEVATPDGPLYLPRQHAEVFSTADGIKQQPGHKLLQAGERYIGLDYFWGGMSAFGYDCSGFTYAMHKANGYQIPRDADDQLAAGMHVATDDIEPGDLLFFAYDEGKGSLHHVGFYYGNGKMLHSPQTGKGIELTELHGTIYEKELCGAARYWQQTEGK
ncbi:gamma-D-glutamyl-L-lysine dipeptidyl-peptidase [Virgibacillus siamensis]|uniref:Gamma-D-glutamyl-L-lysine dipeptidyl-peptidase n=1 Tax=Virgibacillus siamensis TaxID=480071 RepID=A0ABN1G6N4_9BACI